MLDITTHSELSGIRPIVRDMGQGLQLLNRET